MGEISTSWDVGALCHVKIGGKIAVSLFKFKLQRDQQACLENSCVELLHYSIKVFIYVEKVFIITFGDLFFFSAT